MGDRATTQLIAAVREGADFGPLALAAIDWDVVVEELGDGPYTADLFVAIRDAAGDQPEAPDLLARLLSDLSDVAATQECVSALCAMARHRPQFANASLAFAGWPWIAADTAASGRLPFGARSIWPRATPPVSADLRATCSTPMSKMIRSICGRSRPC